MVECDTIKYTLLQLKQFYEKLIPTTNALRGWLEQKRIIEDSSLTKLESNIFLLTKIRVYQHLGDVDIKSPFLLVKAPLKENIQKAYSIPNNRRTEIGSFLTSKKSFMKITSTSTRKISAQLNNSKTDLLPINASQNFLL